MNDDTIVCRCEEIIRGEIVAAVRSGATTISGLKRRTRAGMGLCQGRTCSGLMTRILAEELDLPLRTFRPDTRRPPVLPIPFRVLAEERE